MQLQEVITLIPATKTQRTIMDNIRDTIKEHEVRSKEDYVRRRTMQIATLHFMQCRPFIV
jgi:hypothetical protein